MAIRTGRIDEIALFEDDSHSNFLAALARSAEELSSGKGWPGGIHDLLADLGRVTNTNRVWLFQVLELSDEHMLMNFPFEWVDEKQYELKLNPRYDTKRWDFATCSSVYRTLVESRLRREWQSVIIHELEDCDFKEYQESQDVQSIVSIPVMVQGQWWGLLGFDDCKAPREWSNQELALLRMAAHLISAAVLRNRLSSTHRQFEILSSLTESSAWEMDADSGYFWGDHKIFSQNNYLSENVHMPLFTMVRHIHPNDRAKALRYLRRQIQRKDTNFRWDMRILRGDQYVWVDVIAKISLGENGKLKKLAGISVDIPERKEEEQKLLRKASMDSLTGIANRGAFDDRFKYMLQECEDMERAFSLLLLDVDHFKKINDTWGHAVGDMALKHITQILKRTLRDDDFVARIGGEEFAVLLHCIPPDTSESVAERIRQNIEEAPLITPTATISLTACIGVSNASASSKGCCCDNMLRDADAALYEAKRTGRNKVVVR